jgi:hypothetical protein
LVDGLAASGDWWKAADLFSFTINGIPSSRRLTKNTLKIYKFIEDIFPKQEIIGRAHAYRSESFEYDELVLVGHSEGGLLLSSRK